MVAANSLWFFNVILLYPLATGFQTSLLLILVSLLSVSDFYLAAILVMKTMAKSNFKEDLHMALMSITFKSQYFSPCEF